MRVSARALLAAAAGLLLLPVVVVAVLSFWPVPTTFNVTASTEVLTFETDSTFDAARSWWPLQDVDVSIDRADSAISFSGFFEPARFTRVRVERVAYGPVVITLEPTRNEAGATSVGRFFDWEEREVLRAGEDLEIWIASPGARADSGQTLVIPVAGTVSAGRVGAASSGNTALLRSGTVRMLGRSAIGERIYDAGGAELQPGDEFLVEHATGPAVGLVVADERPALTAAYRVIGHRGIVQRPASGAYPVSISLFERILNEPLLQALFLVFGGAAVLAGILNLFVDAAALFGWAEPRARRRASARIATRLPRPEDEMDPTPAPFVGQPIAEPPAVAEVAATTDEVAPAPEREAADGTKQAGERHSSAAVTRALIAGLLFASSGAAQETVFVRSAEEGQGLLRARGSACFVVLPWHVLEDGSGSADVVGLRGLRGSAQLEVSDAANDLAVLRLESGELSCRAWGGRVDVEAVRAVDGYLRVVEETGTERRVPVVIRDTDSRYITVRLRDAGDQLMKTRSGAALVAGGHVLGMLQRVCGADDPQCREGDGQVLRQDAIMRFTDDFFDVQAPAAAQSVADVGAEYERQRQDAMRVMRARADSMLHDKLAEAGRAVRGELPTLKRDVETVELLAAHGSGECTAQGCAQAPAATVVGSGSVRTLIARVQLTPALLGTSGKLPERIGRCELRGQRGVVRQVNLPRGEVPEVGVHFANHFAVVWGDTAATLPAGEYVLRCTIDGKDFESAPANLSRPVLPWGRFAVSDDGVAEVQRVHLLMDGREAAAWTVAGNGTPKRIEVPASSRMQSTGELSFEVEQISGARVATLRHIACPIEGMGMVSAQLGEKVAEGRWRLSFKYTSPSRVRSGEYAGRCSMYNGVSLFEFVVVVK